LKELGNYKNNRS